MQTATIIFSHANGFPAGTYRALFETWEKAGHRVAAVERFGHDPRYPVSSNWPRLRDQLVDFIAQQGGGAPVHLVGHSLGGYLSLLAASRQPTRVRSVVLIDSPVVAGWRAQSLRVAKLTGLMARLSPGRISARRRWRWPSPQEALAHFAAKPKFARWDERVLHDYLACGTEPDPAALHPEGVRLSFDREIETRLYNTLPHHLNALLHKRPLRCPVGFVGGTQSAEVRQAGMAATQALTHGRVLWIEGSHLVPMERPGRVAQAVLELLA